MLSAKVLTVSDSVVAGTRVDSAGPRLADALVDAGFAVVAREVVADGVAEVELALRAMAHGFAGVVVTTGGTGFAPRDLTPEATARVIERDAPGLAEAMRAVSPLGRLSRGRAGVAGACLIVNTPGSERGALECLGAVVDVLAHAVELLAGAPSPHPPETGGTTATSS
ncbi:MAG: MogA/MoaB family molybdenum cofactor biosynthesis protein [Acidimicrobiales bacterium]